MRGDEGIDPYEYIYKLNDKLQFRIPAYSRKA